MMRAKILLALAIAAAAPAHAAVTGTVRASNTSGAGGEFSFACEGAPACEGTYTGSSRPRDCPNGIAIGGTMRFTGLDLSRSGTYAISAIFRSANFDHRRLADGTCVHAGTVGDLQLALNVTMSGNAGTFSGSVVNPDGLLTLAGSFISSGAPQPPEPSPDSDVTGSALAVGSTASHTIGVSFSCNGEPTCTGSYRAVFDEPGCRNTMVAGFTITGLDLSRPGTPSGTVTFRNWDWAPLQGCNPPPGATFSDSSFPYTATWNGTSGTIAFDYQDSPTLFRFNGTLQAKRQLPPPVFPMTVAANINEARADLSAQIQFRPQDVGTTGSVYVFALAPQPLVKSGREKAASYGHLATGDADTPVQCVLAQLASNGQLMGVSAYNMQAYVTGVLSGQGQAITLLDGVPTANIAGATFYVGYGPSAGEMLDGGLNRSAATVPGALQCKPEPPETGWWWNDTEGGRGYSIEVLGNHLFFAAFHYDASGRSTWHVATGLTSLDGSLYSNHALYAASGGQTLAGAYRGKPTLGEIGRITLTFADRRTGAMVWPGGLVPITRFNIVQGGLDAAPKVGQPQSGWWWNPEEDGRGFFMEWQNGSIDLAGYMYDDSGNPVWYLALYETPNIRAMNGNWWSYANGQAMGGAYKPATRVNDNVAPVTITFSGPDTALMTLPGGRTTALRRHRF